MDPSKYTKAELIKQIEELTAIGQLMANQSTFLSQDKSVIESSDNGKRMKRILKTGTENWYAVKEKWKL